MQIVRFHSHTKHTHRFTQAERYINVAEWILNVMVGSWQDYAPFATYLFLL